MAFTTIDEHIAWLDQLIQQFTNPSLPHAEPQDVLNFAKKWRDVFDQPSYTQFAIDNLLAEIYQKWLREWKRQSFGSIWIYLVKRFQYWVEEQGLQTPKELPPFTDAEKDIALCTQLLETTSEMFQTYYIRGNAYFRVQRYAEAIDDYSYIIAHHPDIVETYALRGAAYYATGSYEQALTDYNDAIKLIPNDACAYTQRGRVHQQLQKYTLAVQDHTMAIALIPKHIEAHYYRGRAYEALGDYQKALDDYSATIQLGRYALDAHDLAAYERRGAIYMHLQQYDEAIQEYSHLLHRLHFKRGMYRPDITRRYSILAQYNLGCRYALQQQHPQAIEALNIAITLGFDDIEQLQHDPDWDRMRASDAFQASCQACRANALKKVTGEENDSKHTKPLTS